MTLPTAKCTPQLHDKFGGACYHCCGACDYGRHVCHFCGEDLRHSDTDWKSKTKHECYVVCECGHIGHEHDADSCRGGDIDFLSTDCGCTSFQPKGEKA